MSACPLCGNDRASVVLRQTDRLYHTTDKLFAVVRCAHCGPMRLDRQRMEEE